MVSKKGFMYSAGVNAVLAEFFGLPSAEQSNTPVASNIPIAGNRPVEHTQIEGLPGKLKA
ncbi:hypothetical protein [Microcoleus sp. herbarium14]|uniref:hypothetical protein n=1 Tax=Microcoleus sp. herbarium14 TaxID=3055439 RepID=UPI002FCF9116